jgi:thiol-disulfide isomerase/thioredoxin
MRTISRFIAVAASGALALLLAGCGRPPHPPALTAPLAPGPYRAVITLPGGELPFGFTVVQQGGRKVVYVINGAESVRMTEIEDHHGRLVLRFPGYLNRIEATRDEAGYMGAAVMVRPGGREVRLPLRAVAGQQYRFYPEPMREPPRVAGRWAVTLTGKDGVASPAVAELKQIGSRVYGTFLTPSGDHRFLEGDVSGVELRLSRFDGGSAYLYHARIAPEGTLSGTLWSGNWSVDTLTAHRDDAASLPEPAEATAAPHAPLAFSFPDLDGRPVALADPRFRDKVVIVSIGGSWCPNCHDEAAFLVPLYRRLHAAGLEIVYLEFEYFGDFRRAAEANRRFVAKFGIDWPVLIAGTTDADEVARKLPGLGRIVAFPTTLVLDRQGHIRKVHSGFAGPATGQHYEDLRRDFTALVEELLAEHG